MRIRLRTKVLRACTKPPTNAYIIANDLRVGIESVKRVLAWATEKKLIEWTDLENGDAPHCAATAEGWEYLERERRL